MKQSSGGRAQRGSVFPDDDAGLDPVVVAEGQPFFEGLRKIGDDVNALFFDAERGNFRESRRLHMAHPGRQGFRAAPLLKQDACSGLNRHPIAREHFDPDFEISRIAHLQQRKAAGHHARALLQDPQNPSAHGRSNRERFRASGAAVLAPRENRLGLLQFKLRHLQGKRCPAFVVLGRGRAHLGGVKFLGRKHFLGEELLQPFEVGRK